MNDVSSNASRARHLAGPRAVDVIGGPRLPELLAPAGDWDCARAAVENGADAIYFGLDRFNARMRAQNFTEADLPKLMEFLHRRGVKGYVTFNTLVFQNELPAAREYLRAIIAAGVDAAIVQDVGICRLIRSMSPDFPIHASTQMTVTSCAGVNFARELGCNLVVLARENSLTEIERIQAEQITQAGLTPGDNPPEDGNGAGPAGEAGTSPNSPLPLEVFVHGALCVAYSGQCLTSEALGGRSANRGECAQACRMPYELVVDGKRVTLGDRRYLLSPQDLAGLEILPQIAATGVASLKIEGRLKTPEYVANITRVYRQSLDKLAAQQAFISSGEKPASGPETERASPGGPERYDLEMAFSRGLYTGWFGGINNQALVHARFGKKRGVYLGEVTHLEGDKIWARLIAPLKPGDGVVFDAGHPDQDEEGGRVYELHPGQGQRRDDTVLGFGRGDIDPGRVHVGDKLWKTSDPELDWRLRRSFEGTSPKFQRALHLEVAGGAGQRMTVVARDELGHVTRMESGLALARAERQPLTTERLREQLGRLGGTPFRMGALENRLEGDVILPVSELNRIRRQVVEELERLRGQPGRWTLNEPERPMTPDGFRPPTARTQPELIVQVRNLPQLEAALHGGVETIYCEFEDPKRYREAVQRAREVFGGDAGRRSIWVAPPRIFKPGEDWILKLVRSCEADGYLIRNYDHLNYYRENRRIGDFSLNVANALAADYFKNGQGLERLTASYDLNAAQLESLVHGAPAEWFEVTIHQHMPMFHMEHCVFCAFLSQGTDYTNCGRPCDRHDVKLRDRVGAEHLLRADAGCRNTVYNARAQTGAEHVGRMMTWGLRHFRIEMVNETPAQVTDLIVRYNQLLRGEITGTELWREFKLQNQLGVTRGALERA